jgi:hypothetical protein
MSGACTIAAGPVMPESQANLTRLSEGDFVTFLWIMLGVLYIVLLVWLGMATLRKGHTALFVLGIFFPLIWVVGALMAPNSAAAAVEARSRLT